MRFLISFALFATAMVFPSFGLAAESNLDATTKENFMPSSSVSAAPVPTADPNLTITRLANGLTVAVKKDTRFPLASLRLYVHAGSAYERPEQAGISHLLEHMVFKGTGKRPKGAVATDVEKAGGYLNAGTSFDYTVYLTDMPAHEWKLGMDVLKDMAFNPALDPDELESEKKVVLAELQRGEDSPSGRLFKRVQARSLPGTPYERPIIGYPETITSFTREGIIAYITALYQPQSMLLLVVGNVEPADALAEATRLFGDIRNTTPAVPPVVIPLEKVRPREANRPVVLVEATPWNKVNLTVSFPCFDQNDARSAALSLFSHRLGGDKTSYLYAKYKYEKRLVDTISVADYTFERTGLFTISATLEPDKVRPFWEEFTKDLANLDAIPFSNEELERARLVITDAFYRQKETIAGTASLLGQFLFFGGSGAEANYLRQIALTDQAAVASVARDILRPATAMVTMLAPEKNMVQSTMKPSPAKEPDNGSPAGLSQKQATVPEAFWMEQVLRDAWPVSRMTKTPARQAADSAREVIELGKGRTLILQQDTSMPYAAVEMAFAGGDALLAPGQQGLGAVVASTLTRGTKSMTATELEAYKSNRAASLAAASTREVFRIFMDYPARFEGDMLQLLGETLASPSFLEEEIARVKESQIASIVAREDMPIDYAFRRLFPFLFGDHLYGYLNIGNKEQIPGFSRKDALEAWTKQTTMPWVLSVCGSFDREAVLAIAKALPIPGKPVPAISSPAWARQKELTITMPDRNQAHLMLVFPGVPVDSGDQPALNLLREILAGQSGLLFRDLRDKEGLGYTVTAIQWQAPLTGAVIFYIGTNPETMDAARDGFARVISSLHTESLAEDELTRGKNQMRNDHIRARQKMSARSAEVAGLAIRGRKLSAEEELIDAAQKLTAADLAAVARKYIRLENAYTLKIVPK